MKKLLKSSICLFFFHAILSPYAYSQDIPYPKSTVIRSLEIDWTTHKRHAPGSDNFPLTWANDGHLYGPWGDGGGFGGTNDLNRVSLGIARIEGTGHKYAGYNRYGHAGVSDFPAMIKGKSWGIICVNDSFYLWVHPDHANGYGAWEDHNRESQLYYSSDKGGTWKPVNWKFTKEDGLIGGNILQFGKNYNGAPDEWVYHYFSDPNVVRDPNGKVTELQVPGRIFLARVHKNKMLFKEAYMFFTGMRNGKPVWTKDLKQKRPAFEDKNGIGSPIGICYNPGLRRYLLTTEHTKGEKGNFGLFEGASPWGPWATVAYYMQSKDSAFGYDHKSHVPPNTFYWSFPTKWISANGRNVILCFTGAGQGENNDSFNSVEARLTEY